MQAENMCLRGIMPNCEANLVNFKMKKSFYILATFVVAMFVASCIDDEETTGSPECAITAFTVADIPCYRTIKTSAGADTVIKVSMSGGGIFFNIDQMNNRIYNVDSLPYWVDLSKIVPTVTSLGNVYVRGDEEPFHAFNNGKDTIDFTKKIEFLVVAYDGVSTKRYKADIRLASNDADSLYWTANTIAAPIQGKHRSVAFNNRLYVFAEGNGAPFVTLCYANSNSMSWSQPLPLTGAAGTIDYASVIAFHDNFYALDENGVIYKSSAESNASVWEKASDKHMKSLLAADDYFIYGYDGEAIWSTEDFVDWYVNGNENLDHLPIHSISYASYSLKTNPYIKNVVMMGINDELSTLESGLVVWFKLSANSTSLNEDWNFINGIIFNQMPRLNHVQMIYYDGQLMAFGADPKVKTDVIKAYDMIYTSNDNGITWHEHYTKLGLPAELLGYAGQVSAAVVNGKIWLVRDDGKVWSGIINKKSDRADD